MVLFYYFDPCSFNTWWLCSIPGGCVQYMVVVFNTWLLGSIHGDCVQYQVVVFNSWWLCSMPGGCVQYLVVVVVVEFVMVVLVGSMAGQSSS